MRLLDLGLFRIGSEDYAERNGSYGLTTMLREHVAVARSEVVFDYPAKSGQRRVHAIGEPSVVIAVSSPHRQDALAACKEAIDTLKERVPLWKKEIYEGGEEWIGRGS